MASSWDALLEKRYGKLNGGAEAAAEGAAAGESEADIRARVGSEEAKRSIDIINACDIAHQPGRAAAFIASGKSLAEVVAALGPLGKRRV